MNVSLRKKIAIKCLNAHYSLNEHNRELYQRIRDTIEEGARAEIIRSGHMDEYGMNSLYLGMKEVAFEMV